MPPCAAATAGSSTANNSALMRLMGSLQEFLFFRLFMADRVEAFHLLELQRRDRRQMADEVHEVPCRLIVASRSVAPGGHSSQPHAVLDDEKDLPVAESLSRPFTHVRRLRI